MKTVVRAVFVILLVCAPLPAAPVKVTVDFTGSGLSAADQTAVLDKIKAKYTGIDVDISTAAGGAVTLKYNDVNGDGAWGDSKKKNHTCKMNAKRWSLGGRAAVFDTAEKRRNLWAETGAHELGHLLCAVHNKDDPPSLMTVGSMVTWAERAADNRAFTDDDKTNIGKGIEMLKAGKSWELEADYDEDDFTVIPGTCQPGPDEPDDFGVTFTANLDSPDYALGYINDSQQFVEWQPPGVPQSDMHFDPYEYANFALERNGTIYPFDSAQGNVIPDLPRAPNLARSGAPTMDYFGRLTLVFAASYVDSPGDVTLTLDADQFGPCNGFALEEVNEIIVPTLSQWGMLLLVLLVAGAGMRMALRRG